MEVQLHLFPASSVRKETKKTAVRVHMYCEAPVAVHEATRCQMHLILIVRSMK
jgi:hypothetical protein